MVKIMSLSRRIEKPKSQEGNKSFLPELKKIVSVSGVFRDSYAYERFYISVYFTHLYILYI